MASLTTRLGLSGVTTAGAPAAAVGEGIIVAVAGAGVIEGSACGWLAAAQAARRDTNIKPRDNERVRALRMAIARIIAEHSKGLPEKGW